MKYRGLTYNREKECYEWVYGMPSYGYETDEIAEIGTVYGDFREIFPDTLGEQTPYRDKNGKEIYTGDIVALEVGGQIREFVVDKATVDREYNTLQGFTGKDGSNTVKVRLGRNENNNNSNLNYCCRGSSIIYSSVEVAKKHLEMWLEAESEVAINQSYTIGGKSFTRANLAEIRKQIEYWSNKVAELENLAKKKGRNRVYRIVPRDL